MVGMALNLGDMLEADGHSESGLTRVRFQPGFSLVL